MGTHDDSPRKGQLTGGLALWEGRTLHPLSPWISLSDVHCPSWTILCGFPLFNEVRELFHSSPVPPVHSEEVELLARTYFTFIPPVN